MIYIKLVVSADITRQIDLSKDAGKMFFGFDASIPKLTYGLTFCDMSTKKVYTGTIKKSGHSATITGDIFSYVKLNHKLDDIIVFEKTNVANQYNFRAFKPGSTQYNNYEKLLKKFGQYNARIKKYTHLIIDDATIPEDRWVQMMDDWLNKLNSLEGKADKLADSEIRALQSEWKEMLAQNMMNLVKKDSRIVCPFTGVEGDFTKLPMLFIASHIKRYADGSSLKEKYDINNGLLLTANADALFDKHMITVSEDKKLIFSKNLDEELKSVLNLVEIVLPEVLNEKRMEYMAEHRRIFAEKEKLRTLGVSEVDIDGRDFFAGGSSNIIELKSKHSSDFNYKFPESDDTYNNVAEETYFVTDKSDVGEIGKLTGVNTILIGCYKNNAHKKWILEQMKYNVRIGKRLGSVGESAEEIPSAQFLVLYHKNQFDNKMCFMLSDSPGNVESASQLNESGYPDANLKNSYFVYQIEYEVLDYELDVEKIMNKASKMNSNYRKGMPIYININ